MYYKIIHGPYNIKLNFGFIYTVVTPFLHAVLVTKRIFDVVGRDFLLSADRSSTIAS